MAALRAYDDELRREVDAARAAGERLAFIGNIHFGPAISPHDLTKALGAADLPQRPSPSRGMGGVRPSPWPSPSLSPSPTRPKSVSPMPTVTASVRRERVKPGHAAFNLKGVEIYASLRCDGTRVRELPIKLHGPGCGSASALGVVSDILKAALRLQGSLPVTGPVADVPFALPPPLPADVLLF